MILNVRAWGIVLASLQVPKSRLGWAGFPCQDDARDNFNRVANHSVVRLGEKRTGKVFMAVLEYLVEAEKAGAEVDMYWIENVMGLAAPPPDGGPSNFDWCVHLMQTTAHRFTVVTELDPRMFNLPASRERLWMPSFARSVLCGVNDMEATANLLRFLQISVTASATLQACVLMRFPRL